MLIPTKRLTDLCASGVPHSADYMRLQQQLLLFRARQQCGSECGAARSGQPGARDRLPGRHY